MSERYGGHRIRASLIHFLVGRAFSSIAGFVALLMIVQYLSVGRFADYSVLQGLVELVTGLSGLGLAQASLRYVPELYTHHYYLALRRFVGSLLLGRALTLGVTVYIAYLLADPATIWLKLAADVFTTFLFVIGARILLHFVSQILESTLHQSYSQAGFALSSFVRLASMSYVLLHGNHGGGHLVVVIVIEATADFAGLLLMLIGLGKVLAENAGTPPADDAAWGRSNLRRIVHFSLKGYAQHLVILPYAGATNRLIGGHFLHSLPMATYGFAQSLYEYVRRYLPSQMLIGLIRPIALARYARDRNFADVADFMADIFKVNLWLLGAAIAYTLVAGSVTIDLLSGGKYHGSAVPLLLILLTTLIFETMSQLVGVLIEAVEKNEFLIPTNALQSLSVLPGLLLLPWLGIAALLLANLAGVFAANIWTLGKLRHIGCVFHQDWTAILKTIAVVVVSALAGTLIARFSNDWVGGIGVVFVYAALLLKYDAQSISTLLTKLGATLQNRHSMPSSPEDATISPRPSAGRKPS